VRYMQQANLLASGGKLVCQHLLPAHAHQTCSAGVRVMGPELDSQSAVRHLSPAQAQLKGQVGCWVILLRIIWCWGRECNLSCQRIMVM
jgi:hypothetical protein